MVCIRGLVHALVVVEVLRKALHRKGDERCGGLALVHCCQSVYGFGFVRHVTYHLPLLARYAMESFSVFNDYSRWDARRPPIRY